MTTDTVDAVVVGGSLRGLVTAWLLQSLGYRAVLVERSERLGGADSSFVTPGGARFDHGLHVLDAHRSPLATRLFQHVVEGRVHRQVLRRGLVLRGHVVPYNPEPEELPAALRALLPAGELVVELGSALPTRAQLARCYGPRFVDLVFDEVLPSYPSEHRHRAFGVDEARLLTNIYPWFFPRARRSAPGADLSRRFHDRLRDGVPQEILYPMAGGFGGFAEGFRRGLDPARVAVVTGTTDLHLELVPGTHQVAWASLGGRRLTARHWFWAGAWPALCKLLALPCQDVATDRVLLGSFVLDRPAASPYHEILVGDPRHWLNRIAFPAKFRCAEDPLVQVEFAVPVAEPWPTDAGTWLGRWEQDLRALGVLAPEHRIREADFRAFTMHFNGFGAEGEALRDADPGLLAPDSNLHPVVPSMANLNLNTWVPAAVAQVTRVLAAAAP